MRESDSRRFILRFAVTDLLAALGAVKGMGGFPVYLNGLPLGIGAVYPLFASHFPAWFLVVAGVLALNIIPLISNGAELESFLRLAQLQLMIFYGLWCARSVFLDQNTPIRLILALGLVSAVVELMVGPSHSRHLGDMVLVRFSVLDTDPNFGAVVPILLLPLCLHRRLFFSCAACGGLILLTASRAALLTAFAAPVLMVVASSRLTRAPMVIAVLIAAFSYPVILEHLAHLSGRSVDIDELNQGASGRIVLQLGYIEIFKNYPLLGTGFWNSRQELLDSLEFDLLKELAQEHHCMFIQILSEFGLPTYLIFCGFLLHCGLAGARNNSPYLVSFLLVILLLVALNGLTTWALWTVIGLVLSLPKANRPKEEEGC